MRCGAWIDSRGVRRLIQSASRQMSTPRLVDTTPPVSGMMRRIHWSSRCKDNSNETTNLIYELDGSASSDDDDDDDATLEDSDLYIQQQSTVVATTVKDRREHSKGYNPLLRRRLEMASVLMILPRHRCDTSSTHFGTQLKAAMMMKCSWHFELHGNLKQDDMEAPIM